jgi:hypothetical protein
MTDYYIIPSFPRYQINRQGNILDTRTGQAAEAIKDTPHAFYLHNKAGKRVKVGLKRVYREVFNAEYCVDTIQDIAGEVWKHIPGTKKRFFVSNKGRVKSLCGYQAIIKKQFDNGKGYQKVCIQGKKYYIHRLVALAFLGEPNPGEDTIHHRNANRKDNTLENL